jgi:hypothetical protein
MSPYLDEILARRRIAEMSKLAEKRRLAASVAHGWVPPIDFHVRFELRLSTRRHAHAS